MLHVKKIFHPNTSLHEAENIFHQLESSHPVSCVNWPSFPYQPGVTFKIGHSGSEIYLQYQVQEKSIRAKYRNDNESVWTDSCVEFFFSPVNDGSYYNIEFNCIGTALIGFGYGKTDRERGGPEVTGKIERNASLGNDAIELREGEFSWSLTVIIPLQAFFRHRLSTFSGMNARGNFYKCGDELAQSHYLSWKPIEFERPNFHLPQYFGEIIFE